MSGRITLFDTLTLLKSKQILMSAKISKLAALIHKMLDGKLQPACQYRNYQNFHLL